MAGRFLQLFGQHASRPPTSDASAALASGERNPSNTNSLASTTQNSASNSPSRRRNKLQVSSSNGAHSVMNSTDADVDMHLAQLQSGLFGSPPRAQHRPHHQNNYRPVLIAPSPVDDDASLLSDEFMSPIDSVFCGEAQPQTSVGAAVFGGSSSSSGGPGSDGAVLFSTPSDATTTVHASQQLFSYYEEEDGNFAPPGRQPLPGRVVNLRRGSATGGATSSSGGVGASYLTGGGAAISSSSNRPGSMRLSGTTATGSSAIRSSAASPTGKTRNSLFDPFEDLTSYSLDHRGEGSSKSRSLNLGISGTSTTYTSSPGSRSTITGASSMSISSPKVSDRLARGSPTRSSAVERISLGESSASPSRRESASGMSMKHQMSPTSSGAFTSSGLPVGMKLGAGERGSSSSTSAGFSSSASSSSSVSEIRRSKNRMSYEEMQQQMEEGCALSRFFSQDIAERPDEAAHEPLVEYYTENLEVVPKPMKLKDGEIYCAPPYKIKILTVEIVPSSILEGNCTPSPKVNGRTKSTSPTRTKTAFQGIIESEFGSDKCKRFFLKLKPSKYAGNGTNSFHTNNDSAMAVWWHKKLTGRVPRVRDDMVCPEIPILGSNPLGTLAALGQTGTTLNLTQLQNTNPLGIPRAKLSALAQSECGLFQNSESGLTKQPHIGIATLFRGMIVPNSLETYQQPGTFGNSRDPRAISEQANMTSPLHGIPRIKVPVCCKRKLCVDKEYHLRQMMINLQSVLQLVYDFTGYAFDFMIDNTLAFCACSTTREKEEGVSYPMVMINLQRIPNKFAVLAHIVGHEYGHVMRGHLQQQCRCQFGPASWQHKMLEYEADQFSALFIATMNIDPKEIYHHLANDEVRLQQLKHFVNTFSSYGDRAEGANAAGSAAANNGSSSYGIGGSGGHPGSPMQRLYKMFANGERK